MSLANTHINRPQTRRIATATLIAAAALGLTGAAAQAAPHRAPSAVAAAHDFAPGSAGAQQSGHGVYGTLTGTLKYLAPGKLTVTSPSGQEQAFDLAPDTKVRGAAGIGGAARITADRSGYDTTHPCAAGEGRQGRWSRGPGPRHRRRRHRRH